MTLRVSTGLRNTMLASNSLRQALQAGGGMRLIIYSGPVPASADAALDGSNIALVEITADGGGGGLNFETTAAAGVLSKDENQTWSGEVDESGEATFYRLVADGDTGGASTSQPRIQGNVGLAGADLNLSSVDLVNGATQPITFFTVTLPTL